MSAQLQTLGGEKSVQPILFRKYLQAAIDAGVKDTTRRIVTARNSIVIPGEFSGLDLAKARGGRMPGEVRAPCTMPSGRVRVVTVLPKVSYGDIYWIKTGRFGAKRTSELTLRVHTVLAARVQDMTEEEAIREGVEYIPDRFRRLGGPRDWFARLWDDINGRGAWERNDWVYVIGFKAYPLNVLDYLKGQP